jgi:hypothetical protein
MEGEGFAAEDLAEATKPIDETVAQPDAMGDEGDFKITIRKLELPVRPRGVLAE